ncbi:MAG: SPOR domain-containing protein [bacterium]|nr:SPOR domain-containing protein [bacterium]
MRRIAALLVCLFLVATAHAERAKSKTPLDLMIEGRFKEAQTILNNSKVSPRYRIMYYALTESEAARACSLYQVVAIRYPKSDCDSVARARMDQAQAMGFALLPIAEWQDAPSAARPLELRAPAPAMSPESPAPLVPEKTAAEPVAESIEPVFEKTPMAAETTASAAEDEPAPSVTANLAKPPEIAPAIGDDIAATPQSESAASAAPSLPKLMPAAPEAERGSPPSAPVTESVVAEKIENVPQPAEEKEIAESETRPAAETPPTDEIPPTKQNPPAEATPPAEEIPQAVETQALIPVAAEPETAKSPTTPESHASNGHWYIQVGAFGNFDNAHRLAKELQQAGFPVKLVLRENPNSKLLQVRVGGYPDRNATEPVKARLKDEFGLPTALVSE